MNLINKFLLILFILTILITSCKKTNKISAIEDNQKISHEFQQWKIKLKNYKPQKKLKIAFSPKSKADTSKESFYWYKGWTSLQDESKKLGIDIYLLPYQLSWTAPERSLIEEQIKLLDQIITQKSVDGIIVGARHTELLSPVIHRAKLANIPVVVIDTLINSKDILTYIEFDNYEAGKTLGNWVANKVKSGNTIVLTGPEIESNAQARKKGFIDGLEKKNIKISHVLDAGWGQKNINAFLPDYKKVLTKTDAIMCPNDIVAGVQILPVLKEMNLKNNVILTGFDGVPEVYPFIKNNEIDATVEQPIGEICQFALQLLSYHIATGQPVPSLFKYNETKIITKENIDQYIK